MKVKIYYVLKKGELSTVLRKGVPAGSIVTPQIPLITGRVIEMEVDKGLLKKNAESYCLRKDVDSTHITNHFSQKAD